MLKEEIDDFLSIKKKGRRRNGLGAFFLYNDVCMYVCEFISDKYNT